MNFFTILFAIVMLTAAAATLVIVNHLLTEYSRDKEHEREMDEKEEERMNELFEDENL